MPATRKATPQSPREPRRGSHPAARPATPSGRLRSRPCSALIEPQNEQRKDASNRPRKRPASSKQRRPKCSRARQSHQDDTLLRLLPGKTRAMTDSEETQLVDALSELLADWLAVRRHEIQTRATRSQ